MRKRRRRDEYVITWIAQTSDGKYNSMANTGSNNNVFTHYVRFALIGITKPPLILSDGVSCTLVTNCVGIAVVLGRLHSINHALRHNRRCNNITVQSRITNSKLNKCLCRVRGLRVV